MTRASLRSVMLIALWLAALWLLIGRGPPDLLAAAAAVGLVSAPAGLVLAALAAIRAAHRRAVLDDHVWFAGLVGGYALGLVVATATALAGGTLLVLSLMAGLGWSWVVAAALLGWAGGRVALRLLGRPFRPFARPRLAYWGGPVLGATLLTGLAAIGSQGPALSAEAGGLPTLVGAAPRYEGGSALLGEAIDAIAVWDAGQLWLGGQIGLPWLAALGLFGAFLAAGSAALAFGLDRAAIARVFGPTDTDPPPPIPTTRLALTSAAVTVLALLALQTLGSVETRLALARTPGAVMAEAAPLPAPVPGAAPALTGGPDSPRSAPRAGPQTLPLPSTLRQRIEAERVGDAYCPAGTIRAVTVLDSAFADQRQAAKARMSDAVGGAFDGIRDRVPEFLDWYYSLGAEYLRSANALVGNGETYLRDQLTTRLTGADAGPQLAALQADASALAALAQAHLAERAALLGPCSMLPPEGAVVEIDAAGASLFEAPEAVEAIGFETRVTAALGGGMAGGVAGVLAGKVVAKVVLSGAFKTAASALAKLAASKALSFTGGVLLGGAGGGAAGSVVPGAGTAVGAVVGGIGGGVAVMLGVDFMLIKLEEEISRDTFATDLATSIDAAEAELLARLGLAVVP